MSYETIKKYLANKYNQFNKEELEILFNNVESLYLSKKAPYVTKPVFDNNDKIATSWVIRAVTQLLEKGDIDITSYSENGLSMALGESMLCEITPYAGVGGN